MTGQALYHPVGEKRSPAPRLRQRPGPTPLWPRPASTPRPSRWATAITFPRNLQGREEIRAGITQLSDQVAARLRQCGMKCQGVSLAIRDPAFRDMSRQHAAAPPPPDLGRELTQAAMELAERLLEYGPPCPGSHRHRHLSHPGRTRRRPSWICLPVTGQEKRERLEKLEGAMDAIRAKYGARRHRSGLRPAGQRAGAPRSPSRGPRGIPGGIAS